MEKGIAPNSTRLLSAGFMAILAAGVGFSIRGGILGDWGKQFGFTQSQLGAITGGGLTGFGIIILLGALIADWIGYGRLMIFAFGMHFLSAVLTLAASPIYNSMHASNPVGAQNAAYQCLYWGMFLFAIGNGTCEAVANPLVATLYPKNRTHYLNILHAGWPAGLVAGGLAAFLMVGKVRWEIQMALFLVPVVFYGVLCLGQSFPKSEASTHGVKFGDRLAEVGSLGVFVLCLIISVWFTQLCVGFNIPQIVGIIAAGALWLGISAVMKFKMGPAMFALLLCIHALLGYVELGTDSWISNITGNILASPSKGLLLFVYTSTLMFALRFCAGPIVHKISPLGLLFVGATCGCIGLSLLGRVQTGILLVIAASIYGIGKTFLWPTMLAVVSERFPKGGAITIGAMGGIGMLSAGLLGGPGIGYNQDYMASQKLQDTAPAVYAQYKSEIKNKFLFFPEIQGLDGSKVGVIRGKDAAVRTPEETQVHDADLHGGQMALKMTAAIPATMAILYLCLILYFKARGGYKPVHIEGTGHDAAEVPNKEPQTV
ncbi:MAG: Major Facilitator Superfamily protein [Pedosphaera sp.]|nr:Major Facilitator Superfamily protein [Pedosphaera sp.]